MNPASSAAADSPADACPVTVQQKMGPYGWWLGTCRSIAGGQIEIPEDELAPTLEDA